MDFLVYKENEQAGPFNEDQLLAMLNTGEVDRRDLVFYEGLGDWQRLEDVFELEEQLRHCLDEGQDAEVVADTFKLISPMLGRDEEVYYIAHPKKKMIRSSVDRVVITSERVIVCREGLTSSKTEDCLWKDVVSVQKKEGLMGTTFSIVERNDHVMEVSDIPAEQISRLSRLSQEMRA